MCDREGLSSRRKVGHPRKEEREHRQEWPLAVRAIAELSLTARSTLPTPAGRGVTERSSPLLCCLPDQHITTCSCSNFEGLQSERYLKHLSCSTCVHSSSAWNVRSVFRPRVTQITSCILGLGEGEGWELPLLPTQDSRLQIWLERRAEPAGLSMPPFILGQLHQCFWW